jgi:hypothetical protein
LFERFSRYKAIFGSFRKLCKSLEWIRTGIKMEYLLA